MVSVAAGSGDQLCPVLPNGQDGKRREKRKKTHPTLPRERRRPAPCPEVTPSCLVLALLWTSTSLAVLCAWPSCFCAESCCRAWVSSRTREGPPTGGATLHASTAPQADPPPSITTMAGGGSACWVALGKRPKGETSMGGDVQVGKIKSYVETGS